MYTYSFAVPHDEYVYIYLFIHIHSLYPMMTFCVYIFIRCTPWWLFVYTYSFAVPHDYMMIHTHNAHHTIHICIFIWCDIFIMVYSEDHAKMLRESIAKGMCIYTCRYIYIYVDIYTYMCIYIFVLIYIRKWIYLYIFIMGYSEDHAEVLRKSIAKGVCICIRR